MSFYSSGLNTRLMDPILDTKNRTEFRMTPESLYITNWRLLNVGLWKTGSATVYTGLGGAVSSIRNISILDGNVQLDIIRNMAEWSSFKGVNMTNSEAINMNNILTKNSRGYITEGLDTLATAAPNPVVNQKYFKTQSFREAGSVTNSEDTTDVAWLDLKAMFPLLSATSTINTNLFKNLKLVIEWETNYDKCLIENDGVINHVRPLLVVDEFADSDVKKETMKEMKAIQYVTLENDTVVVPTITGVRSTNVNPLQKATYSVQGFNNKRVNKVLIQKSPTVVSTYKTAATNTDYGASASIGMVAEEFQVRLNGSNLYPGNGVTQQNQSLAILNDSWGVGVMPMGNILHFKDENKTMASGEIQMGRANYIGFSLNGELVKSFDFTYGRLGQYDATKTDDANQDTTRYNQSVRLNMWAEVLREITPNGKGNYVVRYL